MARVTVEDCVDKVPNRFDLVLLAAHRARLLTTGAPITVARDNDKNPVVALREIAEETVSPAVLMEQSVESLQKLIEVDEPQDDDMAALMGAAHGGDGPGDDLDEEKLLRALMAEQGR